MRGVERSVGVITGELFLVCPAVADVPQLAHQAAFCMPKGIAVDIIPRIPHDPQQCRGIHVVKGVFSDP